MFLALAMVAQASVPHLEPSKARVDMAEDNHYYDGDGHLMFRQQIFWDRYQAHEISPEGGFHVRAWRINKDEDVVPFWKNGDPHYFLDFNVVSADDSMVTHTQSDPEVDDRAIVPLSLRDPLFPDSNLKRDTSGTH